MRTIKFTVLVAIVAGGLTSTANAQTGPIFNDATSAPVVSFSIVDGNLPDGAVDGGGNVNADPLFVDALGPDGMAGTLDDDLRLDAASPAIDAGSDGGDMGAYESSMATTSSERGELPVGLVISEPYPNPFNTKTSFSVSLTRSQHLEIALFDALGRKVQTLYSGIVSPTGARTIAVDGNDLSAGLYFLHISGPGTRATKTVLRAR